MFLHLINAFQQKNHASFLPRVYSSRICKRSDFHSTTKIYLNRFLFDSYELDHDNHDDNVEEKQDEEGRQAGISSSSTTTTLITPKVILPKDDYRTIHAAKILGLNNGDQLRAGIVSCDDYPHGLMTDTATIQWIPEGNVKKAEPLKNGNPPGSLLITLDDMHTPTTSINENQQQQQQQDIIPVSLILALPRPLQLGRMLPMISQMGVDQLILTGSRKVPKDYFGSHLFRKPEVLREKLIEGLCQAGDVRLPNITVVKNIRHFLEEDLDDMFPISTHARVIAHPQRIDSKLPPLRMMDIIFPKTKTKHGDDDDEQNQQSSSSPPSRRIVIAVGPEGGWEEPDELDMFRNLEFQQITLGTRTLRSDCAVISLMSLAHEACQT